MQSARKHKQMKSHGRLEGWRLPTQLEQPGETSQKKAHLNWTNMHTNKTCTVCIILMSENFTKF